MKVHETSTDFFRKNVTSNNRGFSLVELMVVVVISTFILAAAFSVFTSQYRSWMVRTQVSEMQDNARTAAEIMAKELRMAGFGKPEGAVNGFAEAINASNNGTNGSDSITVVTAYRQVSTLAVAASKGDSTITLQSDDDAARFDGSTRRYIYLDGVSEHDNYQVTEVSGSDLTLSSGLVRDYVSGSLVFIVRTLTYSLDFTDPKHPALRRSDNTGGNAQLIAENIEDLQLAYEDGDGNWHNDPPVPEDILAIRINVLARTDREGHEWKTGELGLRPAIEDHDAATEGDGYRRRLMTTVVEARNMGI